LAAALAVEQQGQPRPRLKTAATMLRRQAAIRNISLDTCKRNKWIDQFHFSYDAYAFLHITDWTELILDGASILESASSILESAISCKLLAKSVYAYQF
jgi:hypothetical protein